MVDDPEDSNDGVVDTHVVDLDCPDVVEGNQESIVPANLSSLKSRTSDMKYIRPDVDNLLCYDHEAIED